MTERTVNVFFYGLFMDKGVLQQRGVAPRHPQVASLDGYGIEIRDRATLILHAAERVYGLVTGLTHTEIDALYADPSVRDYRPEAVVVTLEDARQMPALCYTLPQGTSTRRNTAYAVRLLEVAKTLALPREYLEKLQRLTQ